MPRKGSPYGDPAHLAFAAALAARPRVCVHCGRRRATEPDHVPALVQHRHRRGSRCCRLVPSCGPCARKQGGELSGAAAAVRAALGELGDDALEPVGIDQGDPVWRVPWLLELLEVPDEATWPRYMTVPHPDAVGSYGQQAIEWGERNLGVEYRWWQKLCLTRELEHDADGRLVWLTVLPTTARQVGKSTKLRGKAGWRIHSAGLFGQPQEVLHTGKDLPACKKVITPMMTWAEAQGDDLYSVRRQNGTEEIQLLGDGSHWLVRGKGSVYGYSATYGMVDEAWGVNAEVVDDGILPTMLEMRSPQLELTSTAHRKATPLFTARRLLALADLWEPHSTLLLEWSAPRDADIGDELWWRMASPHWGETRQKIISDAYRRIMAGKSLDPDEEDPIESFRAQFLNIWPRSSIVLRGDPLFGEGVWDGAFGDVDDDGGPLVLAVEDWIGRGAAAAAAGMAADGRIVVGGWCFDSREDAYGWVRRFAELRPGSAILCGRSLRDDPAVEEMPGLVDARSSVDTTSALALLRELVAAGQVVQDGSGDVSAQIAAMRVTTTSTGALAVVGGGARLDLARAVAWVVAEAHRGFVPAVH